MTTGDLGEAIGVREMDAFIARQPILNRKLEVVAYELLFRSGLESHFDHGDPDQASTSVIVESLLLPGFEKLTCGRKAHVNLTKATLLRQDVTLLPPESTVVELLETIEGDEEVLEACRRLRARGYRIALDDFQPDQARMPLLDVADIVKIDVLVCGQSERARLAKELRPRGLCLVAEKVETDDMFRETRDAGFDLFQGYFFARPTTFRGKDIPALKLSYLMVLAEIHRPELDLQALRAIVEREVGLSYKLLRYINSAYFGRREVVSSIRHALLLLGEREIRHWVNLVALAGIATGKPNPLQDECLTRGRFCEKIALGSGLGGRASELFLMGLLSLMEAMLDTPIERILDGLPLSDDVKQAMLGSPGPLRDVLDLAIAYGRGNWDSLRGPIERLGLAETDLPELYLDSVSWGQTRKPELLVGLAA